MRQYFGVKSAWRSWKMTERLVPTVNAEGDTITSAVLRISAVVVNYDWEPLTAAKSQCVIREDDYEHLKGCNCGVYAYKKMSSLKEYVGAVTRNKLFTGGVEMVIGEVNLWGRCLEHTLGWRAQFGYPKNFICLEEASIEYESTIFRLAAVYGVPVKHMSLNEVKSTIFGE